MTIQRPSADELIQTRLAATRHLAQSPEGSISPDGFAWSQSYRQDVTKLCLERDALNDLLDTTQDHLAAAEARAEALAEALEALLDDSGFPEGTIRTAKVRAQARAALAGREETGGG